MVSAIIWRTYAQAGLEEMAEHSSVPVINSLSDDFHPCQILADLLTIREHRGDVAGQTMTYFGDGANNMANSYALGGVNAGMHVRIAAPADYQPAAEIVAAAEALAAQTGGSLTVTDDPLPPPPAPTSSSPTPGCPWAKTPPDATTKPHRSRSSRSTRNS